MPASPPNLDLDPAAVLALGFSISGLRGLDEEDAGGGGGGAAGRPLSRCGNGWDSLKQETILSHSLKHFATSILEILLMRFFSPYLPERYSSIHPPSQRPSLLWFTLSPLLLYDSHRFLVPRSKRHGVRGVFFLGDRIPVFRRR
jgi:hypothetical protein